MAAVLVTSVLAVSLSRGVAVAVYVKHAEAGYGEAEGVAGVVEDARAVHVSSYGDGAVGDEGSASAERDESTVAAVDGYAQFAAGTSAAHYEAGIYSASYSSAGSSSSGSAAAASS